MSTPAPGFRAWLALAAGVVVADHITKFIASRGLSYDQPVPVFPKKITHHPWEKLAV